MDLASHGLELEWRHSGETTLRLQKQSAFRRVAQKTKLLANKGSEHFAHIVSLQRAKMSFSHFMKLVEIKLPAEKSYWPLPTVGFVQGWFPHLARLTGTNDKTKLIAIHTHCSKSHVFGVTTSTGVDAAVKLEMKFADCSEAASALPFEIRMELHFPDEDISASDLEAAESHVRVIMTAYEKTNRIQATTTARVHWGALVFLSISAVILLTYLTRPPWAVQTYGRVRQHLVLSYPAVGHLLPQWVVGNPSLDRQ